MEQFIYDFLTYTPSGGCYADFGITAAILGLVSALAAGGASIYNANRQNKKNKQLMEEQREAQFEHENELLDKQNQFNEDMWNKTNAYNSPSAQVERMKQAGLNPNNWNGGATATPISSASANASPTGMIPYQSPDLANIVNSITGGVSNVTDALRQRVNAKKAEQDIKESIARSPTYQAQIDELHSLTDSRDFFENPLKQTQLNELKSRILMYDVQVEEMKAHVDLMKSEQANNQETNKRLKVEAERAADNIASIIAERWSAVGVNKENIKLIKEHVRQAAIDTIIGDKELNLYEFLYPYREGAQVWEGETLQQSAKNALRDVKLNGNEWYNIINKSTQQIGQALGAVGAGASAYHHFQSGRSAGAWSNVIRNPQFSK